nr:MAG TPA: hypothetical protein [Caudoviricetes sp.]
MDLHPIMYKIRKKVSAIVWSLRKYRQPFNPDKLLQSLNNKDHKNTLLNKIHALEQERKEKESVDLVFNIGDKEFKTDFKETMENCGAECLANSIKTIVTEESTPNAMAEINWDNVEEPIDYQEQWDRNSLVDAITKGKSAMKYILDNYEVWNGRLSNADRALSDLKHFCEFNDEVSPDDAVRLFKLMHVYSKQRREYKDLIEVFKDFTAAQSRIESLYASIKHVKTKNDKVEAARHYTPRVLNELFPKEDK